jgi:hypothetical protein
MVIASRMPYSVSATFCITHTHTHTHTSYIGPLYDFAILILSGNGVLCPEGAGFSLSKRLNNGIYITSTWYEEIFLVEVIKLWGAVGLFFLGGGGG